MKRRDFLIGAAAIAISGCSNNLLARLDYGLEFQPLPTLDKELELVGKKEPVLIKKTDEFNDKYALRKKASDAFCEMVYEARKVCIDIAPTSTYRGFEKQQQIWNGYIENKISSGLNLGNAVDEALKYVSLPGTSRHHWGTEIDLYDNAQPLPPKNIPYQDNFKKGGVYADLAEWMDNNASKFGFYRAYTDSAERTGFKYEPWHYSFAEESIPLLNEYLKIQIEKHANVASTYGSERFDLKFFNEFREKYVLGINQLLK